MSPLIGIFVITLLSSILYNKFDANSRATTTRKNPYYSFEKSNTKSARRENLKDERQSSKFWDEKEDDAGFAFENISELDVCIFTVVAGNQKFCKEKTDENLDRLTLLMLSCHTASEDNKFPKCTSEKTFAECISSLNTADLEMFKNVKKRALTVCQEVSQQLFMINSQRRAQALLETAQLHSSVMTSFKDNQKLLENITSQTLSRLRAQRVAFMKDMRLFRKYFTKNESLFMEAAQAHLTLLSRHKEMIGGLEKDVNVLTEGFFQSLEAMQDNFTAFSVKIFEKHREIMANLNRVENTADKILRQLEMIEEYDYTVTLKNVFNWIMANLWRSREVICVVLSSFLIIYGLVLRTKIFIWIKFVLMASVIGGVFLQYEYVGLLIAAWFMSILGEIFIWCFSSLTNGRIEKAETEINTSMGHSLVFGIQEDKTRETSSESSTLNDSLGHNSGNGDNVRSSTSLTVAVTESTTRDSSGENYNIEGDNMGPHTTSVNGLTESTSSQIVNTTSSSSNATENETGNDQSPATRGDSMVLQDTMEGCETQSPVTEHSGSIMGVEVQSSRGNMVQDSTSLDIQEQNRISVRQHEKQSSTSSATRGYSSTKGDFVVQRGMRSNLDFNEGIDLNAHQGLTRGKSVQTSTLCDSEVQTGPGNDMAVQTSNQRDSEVQTGPSEDIAVQTNTTDESSVQTNTDKVIGVQTSTRDDSEVQTDTTIDMAVQTSARDDREVQAGTGNDIAVQASAKNDSYSQTEPISDMGVQTSTRGDSQVQTDTINDMSVQTSAKADSEVQTDTNNDMSVQTAIRDESYSQTEPSNDMGIQTSTRVDSQVHTDTINDMAIQTSTRGDSSIQAGTSSTMAVQTGIGGDTEGQTDTNGDLREHAKSSGDGHAQTDTNSNVGFQTSTRGDSELQMGASSVTGVRMSTKDDSQVQKDTNNDTTLQVSTRGDSHVHMGTSGVTGARSTKSDSQRQTGTTNDTIGQTSARDNMALEARISSVTGVHTRSRGDSNLQTGASNDIRVQPSHNRNLVVWSNDNTPGHSGITYDFGVPHEPLGIQDETTGTIPRQSGIIVNIGDNFNNSRRQTSSPRRHSRTSSPFEVVTGDIRRPSGTHEDTGGSTVMDMSGLRRVSQDISGEAGTSGEFSSIQVGVQINRAGSSGHRRECGLMTLQGTPCRRRVSAGWCYIHRYSRK